MKRFQFKLEPLLNYRKYQERLAQQETARVQMDVKACETAILELKETHIRQANDIEDGLKKGLHSSQFKRYHEYLEAVEDQIADAKRKRTHLKAVLKEKVTILKKKSVDKKAMEMYRDRQQKRYHHELLQTEQKELDEISSLKTARKLSDDMH